MALGLSTTAFAGPPTISDLDLNGVNAVISTFGSSFVFRPLEGPASYGSLWGFSLGVIGGVASDSKIKDAIPGVSSSYIPNAEIFAGIQGPLGLGAEFGFFPNTTIDGVHFNSFGWDLKWTASDLFQLPFNLAFRMMYSTTSVSYTETVDGASDTIAFSSSAFGPNVSVSEKFLFLEPYVGLGYIHQSDRLSNNGTIQLFDESVSATDSYSDRSGSVWFYAGAQMRLLLLTATLEYDNIFGVSSVQGKVAIKF